MAVYDLTMYVRNPPIPIKGPYFTCDGKLTSMKNIANREWLFEALYEGKSAVVKFVKTYGEDVHALLAANQLAPKLYEVKKLCGGMKVVAMEKVDGTLASMASITPGVTNAFKKAVALMQQNNYVHGDLRPQNIIITDNSVRILDFDWAGQEQTVRYPSALDITIKWHPAVRPGGLVEKHHDDYQVQILCH